MRPGPFPWATNDTWIAGPDIGGNTKLEPTLAHKEDGYYRSRLVSPKMWNWMLNRQYLAYQSNARMRAMNLLESDTSTSGLAGAVLDAACYDQLNGYQYVFYRDPGGPPHVVHTQALANGPWVTTASIGATAACDRLDAATSHDGRIAVVGRFTGGAGSEVRTSINSGALWAPAGTPPAAGLYGSIACDRDTAGVGLSRFIIGSMPGGSGVLNTATTIAPLNLTWGPVAGYPALAENVDGLFHTQHPALALGPSDPGHPYWLSLTASYAVRSADGAVWTSAVHGLTGTFDRRCAAWSRTSHRWVVAPQGAGVGDICYSDDYGATWTTITGALPLASGTVMELVSDGYGTFVATNRLAMWVSTDEGLTWTVHAYPIDVTAYTQYILDVSFDATINVDDTPVFPASFYYFLHHNGAAILRPFRSLAV